MYPLLPYCRESNLNCVREASPFRTFAEFK
jgi:hypothetical protein